MLSTGRKAAQVACLAAAASQGCPAATGAASSSPLLVHTRSAHRLADAEALAAKRERRKQRRAANRELRERVGSMHTFGWQCKQAAQPPARARAGSSRAGWEEEQRPRDEWELFQAVLGKPRTAAQRQQFAAAWKEWQAASARAERSASTGGGGSSSDRGPWAAGSSPNGSAASSASSGSSHSSSGSSSNRWTGEGSAGASAGPRWGQASWTWADMRQEAASSAGFAGWGDEEAWYEPPRARSRRGGSGPSSSSSGGSSRQREGCSTAWGWHSSWQQFFGGGWHQAGWQRSGSGSSSSDGGGWGHNSSSMSSTTVSCLQLLGLERGWLTTRCGRRLRACYLAKARALHPDVHAASGERSAAAAEARFKEVQVAYEALLQLVSEPKQR